MDLSFYASTFEIKTLLICFTHGESLTRQGAIEDNRLKEVMFRNRREIETYIPTLAPEAGYRLFAVNVIDAGASPFFQIRVEKRLQGRDRQMKFRLVDRQQPCPFRIDKRNQMTPFFCFTRLAGR